jgi:hypothetical protein
MKLLRQIMLFLVETVALEFPPNGYHNGFHFILLESRENLYLHLLSIFYCVHLATLLKKTRLDHKELYHVELIRAGNTDSWTLDRVTDTNSNPKES